MKLNVVGPFSTWGPTVELAFAINLLHFEDIKEGKSSKCRFFSKQSELYISSQSLDAHSNPA